MVRWFAIALLLAGLPSWAANGPQTRELPKDATPAAATIADIAWLQGHWTGKALGGDVEEMWMPPRQGVMLGMYRLVKNGKPVFYELLTFSEEQGSLVLNLKHFEPDLTSWEERAESRKVALVAKEGDTLYFQGMTFIPNGKDGATIYVAIDSGGKVREERFDYQRVPVQQP